MAAQYFALELKAIVFGHHLTSARRLTVSCILPCLRDVLNIMKLDFRDLKNHPDLKKRVNLAPPSLVNV